MCPTLNSQWVRAELGEGLNLKARQHLPVTTMPGEKLSCELLEGNTPTNWRKEYIGLKEESR